jgi:hypothetical protein
MIGLERCPSHDSEGPRLFRFPAPRHSVRRGSGPGEQHPPAPRHLLLHAGLFFWANVPEDWLDNWWLLMVVILVSLGFVQLLEAFVERHEGWRLNRTAFFTDIFHVVSDATAIMAIR